MSDVDSLVYSNKKEGFSYIKAANESSDHDPMKTMGETVPTTHNKSSLKMHSSQVKGLLESMFESALYTDAGEGDHDRECMTPLTYY